MGDHLHPYKCLPGDHDNPAAEAKCFEWPERATLTISREGEAGAGASCHRIVWNMLNKVRHEYLHSIKMNLLPISRKHFRVTAGLWGASMVTGTGAGRAW